MGVLLLVEHEVRNDSRAKSFVQMFIAARVSIVDSPLTMDSELSH